MSSKKRTSLRQQGAALLAAKATAVEQKALADARRAGAVEQKAAAKAAKSTAKAQTKAAKAQAKSAAKAASQSAKAATKSAKAASKQSQAAQSAAKAAQAAAATKPASIFTKLTDPKLAKRATLLGKIVVPVLAPVMIGAAAAIRGFLDEQRARQLGVPLADVAAYRGPTGSIQARLDGLKDSVADLGARSDNDLQTTRFVEVATQRLEDLTAGARAAKTMPGSQRNGALRAIGAELDRIGADLMTYVLADRRQ